MNNVQSNVFAYLQKHSLIFKLYALLYFSQRLLVHIMISFFTTKPTVPVNKSTQVEKQMEQIQIKPNVEIRLNDLKLVLGPELKIVYPLILNFGVSGELGRVYSG